MRLRPRPRIGVTGPDRGGLAAWIMTARAIRRAGGRPVRITPARRPPRGRLDGLVIGGGADVDPGLYGQDPLALMREIDASEAATGQRLLGFLPYPLLWLLRRLLRTKHHGGDQKRDHREKTRIRRAMAEDLPMLGICRGMQLLNVVHGGTLHQDLEGFYRETPQVRSILPRKTVTLAPNTRLSTLIGPTPLAVNALHHQAVARLGRGLRAVAREPSGLVQAIEGTGPGFVLGVQWHPEYLPQKARHQRFFRGLVRAARSPGWDLHRHGSSPRDPSIMRSDHRSRKVSSRLDPFRL
ncbi:MAG: gamma-glutamyl-gamma-aminobutyrate hydrolase family protein [Ectothiorhodospira sp.]